MNVFKKAYEIAQEQENKLYSAMSLVWQGHMLDLLGRRKEAISIYNKVIDMNVTSTMQHVQFGMENSPSIYAAKRIKEPFKRIENCYKD